MEPTVFHVMKNPIKTFEPNLNGRDFVVGDLHGSLTAFERLLSGINFNKAVDRMFSVGDLVDRGPDSLECLALLKEPWFHCVLANHEQLMIEAFDGGYLGAFWAQNGGLWGFNALEEWRASKKLIINELDRPPPPKHESLRLWDLLDYVRELPYLLTVLRPDGRRFHVIHAEFPPDRGPITDELLTNPEEVLRLATVQTRDGDFLCWGRHIYYQFYNLQVNESKAQRIVDYHFKKGTGIYNPALSHIISGHTILQRPTTIFGQTNIDTCAFGSYKSDAASWKCLTAVDLGSWIFYQATETEFRTAEPLVVNSLQTKAGT